MPQFVKAEKTQAKLRLAIDGPSGSGKTYTALIAATVMADGGKIAVIDTERNSASLYSDKFSFDVAALDTFAPKTYIDLIHAAETAGYSVIVIDSLSHAWEGSGGVLEMHDLATKRQKTQNSYTAWADVTPEHRALIDAMLQSKCHIIATMRSKMDYVQEKDERTGRTVIRKVGMAPIQRQGTEYEFTIVGDMDAEHNLVITKSRCEPISDKVVNKPDSGFFKTILDWLAKPMTKSAKSAPAAQLPAVDYDGNPLDKGPQWEELPGYQMQGAPPAKPMTDQPAPEQPAPVPDENAKAAKMSLEIRRSFVDWCDTWVLDDRAAKYSYSTGGKPKKANMWHILGRVGKLGYPEVTAENVEAVKRDLQKHIEQTA